MNKSMHFSSNLWKKALTVLGLIGGLALSAGPVLAAASVSTLANANVSSDSLNGASVALPVLTITEGAAGDIPLGQLTLMLPNGFAFDTSSIASVTTSGAGLSASSRVSFLDSTHVNLNVLSTSTVAGQLVIGSTTPLKVKASSGMPLANPGNITLSSGTVGGINATTSLGTLTQVPGAANKLSFTVQPPVTSNVNATFTPVSVSVEDQFGNVITSDNGRSITLSFSAISPTTTSGSLLGTLAVNDSAGLSTFSNIGFNATGTIALLANSTSLTGATSNNVVVEAAITPTPTPTPTPTSTPSNVCAVLSLNNGMLVKVQGSGTVYLVVNCTLRPFTSAAIFHARGKKFEDIKDISQDFFQQFSIGKNVGDSSDDNIPTPSPTPTSTSTVSSTLPSISGLPDGSIVKLPGNPTVYQVSGGQLQPFTSLLVFNLNHKSFKDVQTITQAQFSSLVIGAPVAPPDGTLVQGTGSTVFVIQGGKKKGITSLGVLAKHGWNLKDVVHANDGDLNNIGDGGNQDN